MKGQFTLLRCRTPGVQAMAASTRHVFPRHSHEQYGLGVIDQGAHRSLSGRGMVEAGPGDAITVNPGEVHDGAPIGGAARSWRMLYFEPALILTALAEIGEGAPPCQEFSRPVISDAKVANWVRRLFAAMTATSNRSPQLRSDELALALFANVFGDERARKERAAVPSIAKAKALIDDDPAAPVALADLARESNLSRFQVLRAFERATGFTPHAYLMQRRIDLARRLIAKGTALAEAAAASGFADQSHMTRSFVRKYGVSPGAYAAAFA